MSRVPDKIHVGDTVYWADTSTNKKHSFIFSGTAIQYKSDIDNWVIAPVVIHVIESPEGITLNALEALCDAFKIPLSIPANVLKRNVRL